MSDVTADTRIAEIEARAQELDWAVCEQTGSVMCWHEFERIADVATCHQCSVALLAGDVTILLAALRSLRDERDTLAQGGLLLNAVQAATIRSALYRAACHCHLYAPVTAPKHPDQGLCPRCKGLAALTAASPEDGDFAAGSWLAGLAEKAGDGTTDYLVEIRQSDLLRLCNAAASAQMESIARGRGIDEANDRQRAALSVLSEEPPGPIVIDASEPLVTPESD